MRLQMSKISQDIILNATIDKKVMNIDTTVEKDPVAMDAYIDKGSGGVKEIYHDGTIDGKGTKDDPLGVNTEVIATKEDLESKQDKLTAGTNITISDDNVISSTAQESFFRGRFAEWTSVPTSSADYTADFHGNTTPSYNDYIVVEDSSLYIPQDFLSDPNNVMIRNLNSAGVLYTIEVVIQDQIRRIYFTECTDGVYAQINDWLSVTYVRGAPGEWYIKTNKEFYINNVFTPTANKLLLLKTNTPYETNFYLSEEPGVAPVPIYGSWRFVYHGVWADDNILGWKPEYQVEETLPMATDTQAGIAKLYKTSGSNSDGAMTQRAVGNAISAHNTATDAHSNIRGVAGGLATLDNNAKVPMAQINDALLGNVEYMGLWNAAENVPFLADPSGDLPAGYTQLKGITGSGNAYIDTGIVATGQKLTYRISFTTAGNTAWKYLFGACTSDTTQSIIGSAGALGFYANSNRLEISAGDRRIQTTYINPVKEQSNAELTIDTQALTYACTINDNLFTGSYIGNVNRERTIHLFDTNRDKTTASYFTPFAGTIHSFAIEMDGVIVRNMLPARRDSDGVVGMYDTINDVFYGPADVGLFIAVEGDIQLPKGDYYITSVAGDRFGLHFDVGDWVISTGEGWTKVDNTDAVVAVNGKTGNVTITAQEIGAASQEELDNHEVATNAHSNIRGKANGIATLNVNGKVPMSQIDDALLGNVSYQGLWNAQDNVPYLADPAGDLPAGYTQLKSIRPTGLGYIDTGFVFTGEKVKYTATFDINNGSLANTTILGAGATGAKSIYLGAGSNGGMLSIAVGGLYKNLFVMSGGVVYSAEVNVDSTTKSFAVSVNDVHNSTNAYSADIDRTKSVWLFADNNGEEVTKVSTRNLHHFVVEQDGIVVRNMLPARRDSDGVIGMYDIINDVFYGPASTGAFIGTERELELPKGHYYITSVEGDRFGLHFDVGDWAISTGEGWTKVDNTDAVVAVNGKTGNITLNAGDVDAYTKAEVDAMIGSGGGGSMPDRYVAAINGYTGEVFLGCRELGTYTTDEIDAKIAALDAKIEELRALISG